MKSLGWFSKFTTNKILLLIIPFCIFLLLFFTKYITFSQEKQKRLISIVSERKLIVEVADTETEIMTGLMHRKELPWNEGMLFVFPKPENVGFWMKDTTIPLSIAFIDENGVITEILDLKPKDTTLKTSKKKVLYALEVNQGWFKKNGIEIGDVVKELKTK